MALFLIFTLFLPFDFQGSPRDTIMIDSVPFYYYSYGSMPTISAMLFGYWDSRGYGRLIDYYYDRYDIMLDSIIEDVPNVQQELAIAMGTDTMTGGTYISNIAPGQVTVANTINGYNFSSECSPQGGPGNNYLWPWITNEIDAGRPCLWLNINGSGPCLSGTAFGYTQDSLIAGHSPFDSLIYWFYAPLSGNVWVITLVPNGYDSNNIFLTSPVGGEHLQGNEIWHITWEYTGDGIDHIGLYYSLDNCQTWDTITVSTPNTGNFPWLVPNTSCDSLRVKIDAYDASDTLLAADGSRHKVIIEQTGISETFVLRSFNKLSLECRPSPFSEKITIRCQTIDALTEGLPIQLDIYTACGYIVKNLTIKTFNQISWDATNNRGNTLPAGVYFIRLKYEDSSVTERIVYIK